MRSAPTPRRFPARTMSGLLRVALRTVLIASLWHAPIPWVHFHDLEGPVVERIDPLARHIAEFHTGDVGHGHRSLDWHVHLVLPWCFHHYETCPREDDQTPRPEDVCCATTTQAASMTSVAVGRPDSGADAAWGGSVAAPALQEVVATATIPACGWCRHFFETYGRSAAVRDLIGVRLC